MVKCPPSQASGVIHRCEIGGVTAHSYRGQTASMMKPAARRDDDPRNTPVWLRRELLAIGYDDYAIARLVSDGDLRAAASGCVCLEVRLRQARRVRSPRPPCASRGRTGADRGRRSRTRRRCSSSTRRPGGSTSTTVHVDPAGRQGRSPGGRASGSIAERSSNGDVVVRNGVRGDERRRGSALEVTTIADVEPAWCVVNHLLHTGHTTLEQLADRYRTDGPVAAHPDHRPRAATRRPADRVGR